jgi:hypothetical protein
LPRACTIRLSVLCPLRFVVRVLLVVIGVEASIPVAPMPFPECFRALASDTTHLFPGSQTIVLLEFALVVRYTVLTEDPAVGCQ